MIDRRDILKITAAAPLAATVSWNAAMAAPASVDAVVIDQRYDLASRFAPYARVRHAIAGDVTELWSRHLNPAWRRRGFVVSGVTGEDALFVLEHLAWDRGRRVVERREITAADDQTRALISWTIAPVHPSVRS